MKLIVGLGNPGANYQHNRHNLGFMVLDQLVRRYGASKFHLQSKFKGGLAEFDLDGEKIILLKPTTMMNNSGQAVKSVADYYQLDSGSVAVVYDELALPFGQLRLRQGGSSAGHNGIKSVTQMIGSDFIRFRLGIGNQTSNQQAAEKFVLANFTSTEKKQLADICQQTAEIIISSLQNGFEHTSFVLI